MAGDQSAQLSALLRRLRSPNPVEDTRPKARSPISTDSDILAHRLIDLAHLADQVVGKGQIVDSYYGDYKPSLEARSASLEGLGDELGEVAAAARVAITDADDPGRLHDLEATAKGIGTFLRVTADPGALPYRQAVQSILGVEMSVPTETELGTLQAQLQEYLEREGVSAEWPEGLRKWRNRNNVEASAYLEALETKADEYKQCLLDDVLTHVVGHDAGAELIAASVVDYRIVDTPEAWSAYHLYCGDFHSIVELNGRRKFDRSNAAPFASHEVYPGHHAQSLIREYLYRQGELGVEATLTTLNAPGNVVAEGLADYARYLIDKELSDGERIAFLSDQLMTEWRHRLGVALNEGEISEAEASAELVDRTGVDPETAKRGIRFAIEWKYYFPSYAIGLSQVRQLVGRHGKKILRRLYTRELAESSDRDEPERT